MKQKKKLLADPRARQSKKASQGLRHVRLKTPPRNLKPLTFSARSRVTLQHDVLGVEWIPHLVQ
jgi:hypothetical protein